MVNFTLLWFAQVNPRLNDPNNMARAPEVYGVVESVSSKPGESMGHRYPNVEWGGTHAQQAAQSRSWSLFLPWCCSFSLISVLSWPSLDIAPWSIIGFIL